MISGMIRVIISGCRWSDAPLDMGARRHCIIGSGAGQCAGSGSVFHGTARRRRPAAEALLDKHVYQGPRSASAGPAKKEVRVGIGTSRGGRSTKSDPIADAHGRTKVIALTGRWSATIACRRRAMLLDCRRPARDRRCRLRQCRIAPLAANRGSRVDHPRPQEPKAAQSVDAVTYRWRNIVERDLLSP